MRENTESSQPNRRACDLKILPISASTAVRSILHNIVKGKYSQLFNISETYFTMLGIKLLENSN